jgi:hypothetical protein
VSDETEIDPLAFEDPIASRTMAYTQLLNAVDAAQNEDLKKEGLRMLQAIRCSFKAPHGELVGLPAPADQ